MKPFIKKRFAFMGKSMLWSALFYFVLMLAFNWDEVGNTISGKNAITIVSNDQQAPSFPGSANPVLIPAGSSAHTVLKSIVAIVKTVSGLATVSAPN